MDMLDCRLATVVVLVPLFCKSITIPAIEPMVRSIEMTETFFIELEIENGLNQADSHETVQDIEDRKHDNNKTGCFKEEARFGATLDTKGTETYKSEHRQRPNSEGQHRQPAFQEAPRR